MKRKIKREQYIKDDFVGKYWGERQETSSYSPHSTYSINIYEGEIHNAVDCPKDESNRIEENDCQYYPSLNDTIVQFASRFKHDESYFREDLVSVKIYDVALSDTSKEEGYTFGTIKGKIYAAIIYEEEVEEVLVKEGSTPTVPDNPPIVTPPEAPKKPRPPIVHEKLGCLDILSWLFYIFLLILLIGFIAAIGIKGVVIIVAIILFWLFISNFSKGFVMIGRWFMSILSGAFFLLLLLGLFSAFFTDTYSQRKTVHKDKVEEQTKVVADNTLPNQDSIISHYRIWNDYKNQSYEGLVEVLKSDFNSSRSNRENLNLTFYNEQSWTTLYKYLVMNDKAKLNRIYSMLDSIRTENNHSDRSFADVIVSFVQDIPYALIIPTSCYDMYRSDPYIAQLMDNQVECYGNVKYGIQAPVEFMGNLKGDCDTRTILLYCLLSKFGYDVIVLGSTFYQHSILGVHLSAAGKYKSHNGKRYYLWETTAYGLQLGQISPYQTNMNFWNVHLTSYYN